jgi:hypothetical protein
VVLLRDFFYYTSQVLDRGAEAVAQTVACGDATLSQKEKKTRQMSRRAE